jgi:hypothetical protein
LPAAGNLDSRSTELARVLTPDLAKRILDLQPSAENAARVAYLRQRWEAGTLTDEEREEYRQHLETQGFLSFIKVKARSYLATKPVDGRDDVP